MKNFILFFVLLISTSYAGDGKGGNVGNGGTGNIGPQVTKIATRMASAIANHEMIIPRVNMEHYLLLPVIQTTQIVVTAAPLMMDNEVEVDAKNFPEDHTIVFNEKRWDILNCVQKYQLVLHEYLGVMGLEPSQTYFRSAMAVDQYFADPKVCEL